jgi:hypothetical protein
LKPTARIISGPGTPLPAFDALAVLVFWPFRPDTLVELLDGLDGLLDRVAPPAGGPRALLTRLVAADLAGDRPALLLCRKFYQNSPIF